MCTQLIPDPRKQSMVLVQGHILKQRKELIFIECLQCDKHNAKHDTCIISFDPHDHTVS